MIPRYSRSKISNIWSLENKFSLWLEIECLIAEKLSSNGIIPKKAAKDIRKYGAFNIKEIEMIEKETKHDVVAFINNVSSYIGENSKYYHYGVTSSDIVDTAFSIQLKQSAEIIIKELSLLIKALKDKAYLYKNTLMIGRSHGIHAEAITFGIKLASYYCEFKRNLQRLKKAKEEISICAISGPVGTFSSIDASVEKYVAKKLKLETEKVSTQVIPRDRHAVFFTTLGILASSIERLAIEIRNLQRTEILEVEEFFSKKQKGSSAMPHKRNPVLSENLTGLARYIRSAVIPSMENIALWHERDISHSSVERIFAPDITIATDFTISRMVSIIQNLVVYPKNMKKNLESLNGVNKSQILLLALIKNGVSRQKAYQIVQSATIKAKNSDKKLKNILNKNTIFNSYIKPTELNRLLFLKNEKINIERIFKEAFKNTK